MRNWPMIKVADEFDLQMGKTPARDNPAYWGGDQKWASIADIGRSGMYLSDTKETITQAAVSETGIKAIPSNTVVMSFKLSIGRTAITASRMYTNEAIMAFLPHDATAFDLHFLYHLFSNRNWSEGCNKAVKGVTLNKATLNAARIPKPDISEQRAVASTLDKICALMAKCDEQIVRLDQLVKSRFVEMFGDPMTNPKGWSIGCISDIAKYWNGLTYKPDDVSEQGTIVLRSSNIQNGCLDFADIVRVNLDAKEKNLVVPGDILMCSRNGSAALVGKTTIIPRLPEKMYFGAFMMVLRCSEPTFLNAYFKTKAFRAQIVCGQTTTVNQITCSMMDKVPLQREFAAFVAKVDKLAFAARQRREVAKQLYRAKIQEFFG